LVRHDDTAGLRDRSGWLGLVGFVALCFAAAAVGGLLTAPGLREWYAQIRKPDWTPPSWVFGPVWSALYLAMGVAAWEVWRQWHAPGRGFALGLFLTQLGLNVLWPAVFFTLRSPALAAFEIVILWAAVAATTAAFARISRTAAMLMAPYLAWVTFASCLNFVIWRLN